MNSNKLAVSLLSLIGLLFVGACQPAASPETETPVPPTVTAEPLTATPEPQIRILFIGDSFTSMHRGIDNHIEGLAASVDPPLNVEGENIAAGGASLRRQWNGARALPAIQDGNWTVVVLQEDLATYSYNEQLFYDYARNFDEEINNIGAETVLYMPWEYDNGNPMTTEEIANAYGNIGAELGVKVAPVGLAWRRSIAERPDLDLYSSDRVHPSISGTYLTIAVLYATIFGETPEGLPFVPADLLIGGEESLSYEEWKMSEEDIAFLQRIAWETVVDYQEENN